VQSDFFGMNFAGLFTRELFKSCGNTLTIEAVMGNYQSVLLIEPDTLLQSFIVEKLTEMGCNVAVAADFEQAQELQQTERYDLVLKDLPKPFSLGVLEWRLKNSISWQPTPKRITVSA
jgi:response regulator RpfG family c-di-GMP phosphodiesterase